VYVNAISLTEVKDRRQIKGVNDQLAPPHYTLDQYPYEALSHCWGGIRDKRAIRYNSAHFNVSANLWSTLCNLQFDNRGVPYGNQGKLAEAEQMYQRALPRREKVPGPNHTSTLDTVNNLGNLYLNQGRLAKAERMYQRALAEREKALGQDHTSTLDTVNNRGLLYKNQGKTEQARTMLGS